MIFKIFLLLFFPRLFHCENFVFLYFLIVLYRIIFHEPDNLTYPFETETCFLYLKLNYIKLSSFYILESFDENILFPFNNFK